MAEEIVEGAPASVAPVVPAAPAATVVTPAPAPVPSGVDYEKAHKGALADLKKERDLRQKHEAAARDFQTKFEAEQKRVQALAGLAPKSAGDAEAEAVRARFGELFPHLNGLTAEDIADMREAKKDRERLQDLEKNYWGKHGKAMVGDVAKELSATYGGELTKRQTDQITQAYVLRAQSDPEFLERHESGDPTLVKEFAKEWVEDWFEPAKRQAIKSQVCQFRPVPNGQVRNIVNQGEKKIDVNNNDQVMDMLVAGRTFTGRNR